MLNRVTVLTPDWGGQIQELQDAAMHKQSAQAKAEFGEIPNQYGDRMRYISRIVFLFERSQKRDPAPDARDCWRVNKKSAPTHFLYESGGVRSFCAMRGIYER